MYAVHLNGGGDSGAGFQAETGFNKGATRGQKGVVVPYLLDSIWIGPRKGLCNAN